MRVARALRWKAHSPRPFRKLSSLSLKQCQLRSVPIQRILVTLRICGRNAPRSIGETLPGPFSELPGTRVGTRRLLRRLAAHMSWIDTIVVAQIWTPSMEWMKPDSALSNALRVLSPRLPASLWFIDAAIRRRRCVRWTRRHMRNTKRVLARKKERQVGPMAMAAKV